MKTDIVYSHTYDPQLEADFLANVSPRRRHELMLERHAEKKASRREPLRGRKIRRVVADLI